MDNLYLIIFFSTLAVLFIFLASIINVRGKNKLISAGDDKDFIDKFVQNKNEKLKKSPGSLSIKAYIRMMIFVPIITAVILWFTTKNVWLVVIGYIISIFTPEIITLVSENKRKKNFEERYARALRQLSASLRAGMTLQQAVVDLCNCPFIHYDIKREFKKIDSDIKIGISVPQAFQNMAERVPTEDVKDVASAVKMESMVGGSEAESIEYISNNISSRIMLKKEIKTLFASVKVTIWGMDLLPAIMVIGMYTMSPTYFTPAIKTTIGKLAIIAAIVMMIIGSFVNRWFLKQVKGVNV